MVDRPANREVIDSRVVSRNKKRNLDRRKACIVARNFSPQRPGIDFLETLAPVARLSTIRTMMALAAEFGMITNQYDVITTYLNGELKEEIFMEVPVLTEEILELIIDTELKNSEVRKKVTSMLIEYVLCTHF